MFGTNSADATDHGAALAYFNNAKRGGLLAGAGPVFWVVACGAALILAILAGTSIIVENFRDREIKRSERELENTVQLLAQHFHLQLEDFEAVESSIAGEIEPRVRTPEEFKQVLSSGEMHQLLRTKLSGSSDFAGINVFDAEGTFINSSERWPVPFLNLSDRDYFRAFKSGSNKGSVTIRTCRESSLPGANCSCCTEDLGTQRRILGDDHEEHPSG
jgi:hypothetical protein